MLKSTDVFLSFGRRGSGKSYLSRKIAEAFPRKVIFDPLSEHSHDSGIVCHSFDEFGRVMLEKEHASEFTIIYQFDVEKENHEEQFNEALRVLWYRGNVLIVIEECQMFSRPHSMPLWLRNALLTGRHRNIGLIFTTQRPGECHKTIVSQANHVFCGSLHEKNDIEYARTVLGDKAYELVSLPERQFMYFKPGQPTVKVDSDLNQIPSEALRGLSDL